MLKFLDYFFVVLHTSLSLFNLLGWAWYKTRRLNLILLLLTGASWGLLGIFYGLGYCPLTDWHWQVLHKLGKTDIPPSYIEYLIERITSTGIPSGITDIAVATGFGAALTVSFLLNVRDYRFRRHKKQRQRSL